MGDLAMNVANAYQIGAARGDYSILSAMDIRDDELFAEFGRSINDMILKHRKDLERKREARCIELNLDRSWLDASSSGAGPKTRWVDATPEYSLHICGLRRLFPQALFVHLFRDVGAVVRSMVNFHRVAGIKLVASEEDAYRYWMRTVTACLLAERAYGPTVIHRVRYTDLITDSEPTMRSLLDFLDEPYSERCLKPLSERINSSNVPPDFRSDDPATDPAIVEEARRLSAETDESPQPTEYSPVAVAKLEAEFCAQITHIARLR